MFRRAARDRSRDQHPTHFAERRGGKKAGILASCRAPERHAVTPGASGAHRSPCHGATAEVEFYSCDKNEMETICAAIHLVCGHFRIQLHYSRLKEINDFGRSVITG